MARSASRKSAASDQGSGATVGYEAQLYRSADALHGLIDAAPPKGHVSVVWVHHLVHPLATAGVPGFLLANCSSSSDQSGGGEIRKTLIEADLVECIVAAERPSVVRAEALR